MREGESVCVHVCAYVCVCVFVCVCGAHVRACVCVSTYVVCNECVGYLHVRE